MAVDLTQLLSDVRAQREIDTSLSTLLLGLADLVKSSDANDLAATITDPVNRTAIAAAITGGTSHIAVTVNDEELLDAIRLAVEPFQGARSPERDAAVKLALTAPNFDMAATVTALRQQLEAKTAEATDLALQLEVREAAPMEPAKS